jgi:D-alanyl-D-alanine carboxypeptidase
MPRPTRTTLLILGAFIVLSFGVPTSPADANAGWPPACRTSGGSVIVRDWAAQHRHHADWHLTLVDTLYTVGSAYAPADLVSVSNAGIAGAGYVRRLALSDLRAMDRAARAVGIRLRVVSAYRSHASQRAVFASWVQKSGYVQAVQYSARAGHSEHQLGTTIDFSFVGGGDPWNYADFGRTRAGVWLKGNAWRYGWILSYPAGASRQVCYGYEPWHYRYVGRSLAASQRNSGLAPRSWLWRRQ